MKKKKEKIKKRKYKFVYTLNSRALIFTNKSKLTVQEDYKADVIKTETLNEYYMRINKNND